MSGELIDTAAAGGATRASQTLPATLAMSFLAGAYIALGGFLAVRCGAMLPWEVWGSMGKLVFAMVFPHRHLRGGSFYRQLLKPHGCLGEENRQYP